MKYSQFVEENGIPNEPNNTPNEPNELPNQPSKTPKNIIKPFKRDEIQKLRKPEDNNSRTGDWEVDEQSSYDYDVADFQNIEESPKLKGKNIVNQFTQLEYYPIDEKVGNDKFDRQFKTLDAVNHFKDKILPQIPDGSFMFLDGDSNDEVTIGSRGAIPKMWDIVRQSLGFEDREEWSGASLAIRNGDEIIPITKDDYDGHLSDDDWWQFHLDEINDTLIDGLENLEENFEFPGMTFDDIKYSWMDKNHNLGADIGASRDVARHFWGGANDGYNDDDVTSKIFSDRRKDLYDNIASTMYYDYVDELEEYGDDYFDDLFNENEEEIQKALGRDNIDSFYNFVKKDFVDEIEQIDSIPTRQQRTKDKIYERFPGSTQFDALRKFVDSEDKDKVKNIIERIEKYRKSIDAIEPPQLKLRRMYDAN